MKKRRVLLATGGTGGHIFPAMALARKLQTQGVDVLFCGNRLKDKSYFTEEGFDYREIHSARGLRLLVGLIQALFILLGFRPHIVVSFGGYPSFPASAIGRALGAPLVLFESNAVAGKVTQALSRFAKWCASPSTHIEGSVHCPIKKVKPPIWESEAVDKAHACAMFGLDPKKKTLLVFGGSLGAGALNEVLIDRDVDLQVLHITGGDTDAVEKAYINAGVKARVYPFIHPMSLAWTAADCVIARGGGMTMMEMEYYSVPGIIVPLPNSAENHQLKNALRGEQQSVALCLPQDELSKERVCTLLKTLRDVSRQVSSAPHLFQCVMEVLE